MCTEFPICVADHHGGDVAASVDYGQFLSFVENDDGQITCLQQGTRYQYT